MGKNKKRVGKDKNSPYRIAIDVARKLYKQFGCGVHVGMKGGTMVVYWSLIKCRPDFAGCFYVDAFRAYLENRPSSSCRKQEPSEPRAGIFVPGPMSINIPSPAPNKPSPKGLITPEFVKRDDFLLSYEWRKVRMVILKQYGSRCQCCGATPEDGVKMHVDHIKPRKTHPELALDSSNLQVLCEVCNHGKGNWDSTDWRPTSETKH